MDAQGALEHRRALLAGLAGRVLEVGAGSGLNFAHYPPAVTELLAVEPEPYLRALAETAAQQAAIPIRVVDGTADTLPSPRCRHGRRRRIVGAVLGARPSPRPG